MPHIESKDRQIEMLKKTGFERISKEKVLLKVSSKIYLVDGFSSSLTTEIYRRKKLNLSTLTTMARNHFPQSKDVNRDVLKLISRLAAIKAIRFK